jgi:homoserine kinase type II
MANYTQLSLNQVQMILSLYGPGKIERMTPMSTGISNSNYRLDLTGSDVKSVLLKISNDKNQNELQQEQEILKLLQEHQYPYSLAPFSTLKGELVYSFEHLHGVIFPFVQGEILSPCSDVCEQIGMALGRLHALNDQLPTEKIRHHSTVGFDHQNITPQHETMLKMAGLYSQCRELLPVDPTEFYQLLNLRQGLIHGDLYYDNVLFQHGKLLTLLDFEQAGIGPQLLDIGISISGTCLTAQKELDRELIESYLHGYQKSHSLSKIELQYMDDCIILGLISIALWRVKRFNILGLDKTKIDNYKELLNRASTFKKYKDHA